jgi:hypothetical protein
MPITLAIVVFPIVRETARPRSGPALEKPDGDPNPVDDLFFRSPMLGFMIRSAGVSASTLLKWAVYKRGLPGAQGAQARASSQKLSPFSRFYRPAPEGVGFPFRTSHLKLE